MRMPHFGDLSGEEGAEIHPCASRRTVLRSLLATCGVVATSACTRPLVPLCADSPVWTDPSGDLGIDVHAHVFNATDLPVEEFFSKIVSRQLNNFGSLAKGIGPILQTMGWNLDRKSVV